jgi:subtilisin family serine protease
MRPRCCFALLVALTAIPVARAATPSTWLVIMRSTSMTADSLQSAIAPLGGSIVAAYPETGTFVVAADAGFRTAAAGLSGVSSVVPNVPLPVTREDATAADAPVQATLPADEPYFSFQWGLRAIHAKGAWDAGFTGAGVRVAVLDTNFDVTHPDLAPNIDPALPRSFVPGEPIAPPPDATTSHGTLVAGIIAATANGVGTVGVAPDAEIVPIKVVSDAGDIQLPWFLDGMHHAVTVGADVVNMSFIVHLPKEGFCLDPPTNSICFSAKDVSAIGKAVERAVLLARRSGITLVAAAGNEQQLLDRRDDVLSLPAETRGVLAVAALGPTDWALDQNTDLDVPQSYSDYGKVVAFSAPGGIVGYPEDGPTCDLGLDLGIGPIPCRWFDKEVSTNLGGTYHFIGGTSMASPHVAGVAALIIGKHGGSMSPSRVQAILRKSADDLGPIGRDDHFGWGRVNAERAVAGAATSRQPFRNEAHPKDAVSTEPNDRSQMGPSSLRRFPEPW